jgi:Tfp pilus assembly protein PilX
MKSGKIVSRVMDDEGGFVLVAAMIVLLILTLIGISALNTSNTEIQIGGNDRLRKQVFSQADGGTQLAIRLLEENIGALSGFTAITAGVLDNSDNKVLIDTPTLSKNPALPATRDAAYYPEGYTIALANTPHTNMTAGRKNAFTEVVEGAGLGFGGGYEPKGLSSASGGGRILFTILSQHRGPRGSESVVEVEWRHIIGLELVSRY